MSGKRCSLLNDEGGATMIEFTAVAFTFFLMLFGVIEFSYAFYQWNAASKAVQVGARLASVSSPVTSGLADIDGLSVIECEVEGATEDCTLIPGEKFEKFLGSGDAIYRFVCEYSGSTPTCTCSAGSYCPDPDDVNAIADNLQRIACGYNLCPGTDPVCPNPVDGLGEKDSRLLGMCHFFPRVKPQNVRVTYEYTGLGYAGRPGGPVPTVTVELKDLDFELILTGGLLGASSISMPDFATTVTGEDLSVTWSES